MNRELLFRGKLKRTNRFAPDMIAGAWIFGGIYVNSEKQKAYIIDNYESKLYEVDYKTIGQFTNVCDKNGLKIFEGHKIQTKHGSNYIVKDMIEFHYWLDRQFVSNSEKYIEIVGNVE